jgi:hypothetical protein
VGLIELVDRVLGEVLVAQDLRGGEAQFDRRFVVRRSAVVAVVGVRVVVAVDGDRDVDLLDRFVVGVAGIMVLEEHGERPIEHADVLGTPDERGAPRPVHPASIAQADGVERLGERVGATGGDLEAGAAQHPGERDRDLRRVAAGSDDVEVGGRIRRGQRGHRERRAPRLSGVRDPSRRPA